MSEETLAQLIGQAESEGAGLVTLRAIAEGLAGWFPGATLAVDLDRVTALAEDRERLWAQVNAAGFLSDDEKREMVGVRP